MLTLIRHDAGRTDGDYCSTDYKSLPIRPAVPGSRELQGQGLDFVQVKTSKLYT